MLTTHDDFLGHQIAATFDRAGNGDPRWTERYWYTAHPVDGTPMIIDIGLGYYPNRGVMDVFAGVTIEKTQHNFRASRRLGNDPLETTVGPLSIRVLEGQKRHRVILASNESGMSFDLQFEASFPATQEVQSYRERDGRVEEDLTRLAQFGRWSGTLVVDGKQYVIEPTKWRGQRDRSWGLRSVMNTDPVRPPVQNHKNLFWTWSMFQFDELAFTLFIKERSGKAFYLSGAESRRNADGTFSTREVVAVEHDIQWADDPLGQTIAKAEFRLSFAEGPPRVVEMTGLEARYYLKSGMYGGLGGWQQGDDRGDYYSAADVWDLSDAKDREIARTLSDHAVRATCDGAVGWGISEYGIAGGYPRYEAPQRFPAF